VRIVHGRLRDAQASAFAVVKNEQFYIRAFLDHHRRIGVEQFLFVDDRSTDGTRELLASQPDCVVLESPHAYGEVIALPGPAGERRLRAGIAFKTLVPRAFLAGRYAICLDADELLVLPPGVDSVGELVQRLARHDVRAVAATLVDFFPATIEEMDRPREFATAADLLAAYPYFDALPLLGAKPGRAWPAKVGRGATARLFREHGVRLVPDAMQAAPRWLNRRLPYPHPKSSVRKTPIMRWDAGVEYLNSHRASVAASDRVLAGLAHLKFTWDLSRRVDYALASKAYVRGSRKYRWYEELLEAMRRERAGFLGPHSRPYRSPADFASAGLTRLDLD
jgi:hypothetical protein